jgi:hypothetical protein
MNFRTFADTAKGGMEHLVAGLRGERDPTPMVMLAQGEEVFMVAVDSDFFHPEFPERRRELLARFVLPMIGEHGAQFVALTYAGWLYSNAPDELIRQEVLSVTVVDREVAEVWWAPLWREAPGRDFLLGEWRSWPANRQVGRFVTPIQEALR